MPSPVALGERQNLAANRFVTGSMITLGHILVVFDHCGAAANRNHMVLRAEPVDCAAGQKLNFRLLRLGPESAACRPG